MVSSDDSSELNLSSDVYQRVLAQFQGDWAKRLNVEQMFTLINGVLPLEACLYYQVLPLFLEGNRLHLGMVTPNDTSALEYVRRIVSYLNYSLVPRAITYDALQVALTGYLNCTGAASKTKNSPELFSYGHHRHSSHSRRDRVDQSNRPTLILDDPDEFLNEFESTRMPESALPPPELPASPALPPPSADYPIEQITVLQEDGLPDDILHSNKQVQDDMGRSPHLNSTPAHPSPDLVAPSQQANASQSLPQLIDAVPALEIQANHLSSSVEVLASLPAKDLLQELLARVLLGGIGRLYFECHAQYGRVLWSQDGVLQSVLDSLPLPVFAQLLAELKRVAQLAPIPVTQPKHAEIERLYDRNRVLLRFRFMPNQYGEEATLQVLRGAALRFYQRQQLTKLKRDALGIAKQLQTKLNEIRDRAYAEPGLSAARFESLPALNQLLQTIEEQLNDLEEKG
ncbi:pilus assembly protein PilB [filamentous cyanobacterium CCP1]|nr:pilus assembly protein PilB [filamentous cyanobacterium CCP2]PSB63937.1 pilus assembly protein PilB [filamentous cyanobacterium CCP1]